MVYVEAIAGKTFPAPTEHPVMDQKGLMFRPTSWWCSRARRWIS